MHRKTLSQQGKRSHCFRSAAGTAAGTAAGSRKTGTIHLEQRTVVKTYSGKFPAPDATGIQRNQIVAQQKTQRGPVAEYHRDPLCPFCQAHRTTAYSLAARSPFPSCWRTPSARQPYRNATASIRSRYNAGERCLSVRPFPLIRCIAIHLCQKILPVRSSQDHLDLMRQRQRFLHIPLRQHPRHAPSASPHRSHVPSDGALPSRSAHPCPVHPESAGSNLPPSSDGSRKRPPTDANRDCPSTDTARSPSDFTCRNASREAGPRLTRSPANNNPASRRFPVRSSPATPAIVAGIPEYHPKHTSVIIFPDPKRKTPV